MLEEWKIQADFANWGLSLDYCDSGAGPAISCGTTLELGGGNSGSRASTQGRPHSWRCASSIPSPSISCYADERAYTSTGLLLPSENLLHQIGTCKWLISWVSGSQVSVLLWWRFASQFYLWVSVRVSVAPLLSLHGNKVHKQDGHVHVQSHSSWPPNHRSLAAECGTVGDRLNLDSG